MKKNLDPNNLQDLEQIVSILDDQDIQYQIVVLTDDLFEENLLRDFSIDVNQATFEVNFWQQIYFDYSEPEE